MNVILIVVAGLFQLRYYEIVMCNLFATFNENAICWCGNGFEPISCIHLGTPFYGTGVVNLC